MIQPRVLLTVCFLLTLFTISYSQQKREPIIDMHVHANHVNFAGQVPMTMCYHNEQWPVANTGADWGDTLIAAAKKCRHSIISETSDDVLMEKSIAIMKRRNIISVTSGRRTDTWKTKAPERIISSFYFRADGKDPSPDSLRKLFQTGKYTVFGEVAVQYNGVSATDSSLAPYWALAEELNIPVGFHIGNAPIGAPFLGWKKLRAKLNDPLQLEEVLNKHPKLRVYVMHAGWPMIDNLLALLYTYPQVYIDISGIVTDLNKPAFYAYLKPIILNGFGNRIMFGSDLMIWPEIIEIAIETIESADFLSKKQKRDILYNNAARFLKLSDDVIRKHHGGN